MAEQTFKSPGFFEKEVDLSIREQQPAGTPGCIIGAASSGPAFVNGLTSFILIDDLSFLVLTLGFFFLRYSPIPAIFV